MQELYGRKTIYSDAEEINRDNILDVLKKAKQVHEENRKQEEYLLDYYRGKQEIRNKEKSTRPEINHKVTENKCFAAVDFRTGYIAGDPIVYTSRGTDESVTEKISKLNALMISEEKETSDKDLFDWMHITGLGYRMVLPDRDYNEDESEDEAPFELIVLEPMSTFCIYSSRIGHKKLAGVYYVQDENRDLIYAVYTNNKYYKIKNLNEIVEEFDYPLGIIPIFEYRLNSSMIGVFEPAIGIQDAINYLNSDRLDGETTFVNSLCVLYNAELPEGEDGNSIRDRGLIVLHSNGENKADIKVISENLDQSGAQSLKDDLNIAFLRTVGMPDQSDGSTSDSSNNGSMFLKQGYQLAETRTKGAELMFKKSEREMLKLIFRICRNMKDLDLNMSDVDITFTRKAYSDIVSKSTVLTQMLGNEKVAPIDAWTLSGITPDPEEATKRGLEWFLQNAKDSKNEESEAEATINNEPVIA